MMLRAVDAIEKFIRLPHSVHRTIQSCFVVVFCSGLIAYVLVVHHDDDTSSLATRAMDWSFGVLLGTVGVYHFSGMVSGVWNNNLEKST